MSNARDRQEGGNHYKDMDVQPWDALACWLTDEQLTGYFLGSALAYQARFNATGEGKGGLLDLKKARHYLDTLIEHLESADQVAALKRMIRPPAAPIPVYWPDGWIPWTWSKSAPYPALAVGQKAQVWYDGEIEVNRVPCNASSLDWSPSAPLRIIAYKVVEA